MTGVQTCALPISSASLAWDAMLLKTKIELDLISDVNILDMFEKSKRGGLTFVGAKRYAQVNNKEMGKQYDKNNPDSYITYVDANNLYGWAMSEALPYKDIKFVEGVTLETLLSTEDDADWVYGGS